MKLDSRGFTLVELLAVVVILVIITAIAIPSISSSIERTNDNQIEGKKKMLESAADLYVGDHRKYRNNFKAGKCYISVDDLINSEYITKDEVMVNGEKIGNFVYYTNDGSFGVVDNVNGSSKKCSEMGS